MRRIALWFASTVSVVVLLFGYHTSTSGPGAGASGPPAVISASSATSSSSSSSSSSGSSRSSGSSGSSRASARSGAAGSSTTRSTRTVTGQVAQTQWGPVQVELTITGRRITTVAVPQYPSGNGQDQQINSYALPTLVQETIDAQGSNIDMVSGATVTSTGYLQSLQSALDQANL